tara:strand:+ start:66 stop:644 length:579 start_codon:yes stop_codon:yes gene_type:complete
MPNWCENHVVLATKNKKKLEKIVDIIKNYDIDNENHRWLGLLNYLCPIPESEIENWYDWCCENWGTKWELDILETMDADDIKIYMGVNDDNYKLQLNFNSAWSPPKEAFNHWVKNNRDVSLEMNYYEGGNSFCGKYCLAIVDDISVVIDRNYENFCYWGRNDDRWNQGGVFGELDDIFGIMENNWFDDSDDE